MSALRSTSEQLQKYLKRSEDGRVALPSMVVLPIKLQSVANLREHWSKRAARAKEHRSAAYLAFSNMGKLPCSIKMTRIAPRFLDDDNLHSAFKAIRDGLADRLGIKDNDPRVVWQYAQERGKPKEYAVRIEYAPLDQLGCP